MVSGLSTNKAKLGIEVYNLKKIMDERGYIAHFLKATDPWFIKFGEVYFSTCFPNKIKGWHIHSEMTLNYVCIIGNIQIVCSDRNIHETYFIGENNYCLVKIPAGIWNAYRTIGNQTAVIANCATIPHDKNEISRIPLEEIDYKWDFNY